MRSNVESVIKLEIEHVFGRRIVSSRDCIQLSDEIFKKTQFQLNPNTLRRFFGIVKTEYPASLATLNILSNYCGFRSIDDVSNYKREESEVEFVEQKNVLNLLVSLFTEISVLQEDDEVFRALIVNTIKFLNTHPSLREKFQSIIVKTENGQKYYFEYYVQLDNLDSFYGNGLRYYLNEKRTEDAHVFVHSLLIFRYWLTNEDNKLENHFHLIRQDERPYVQPVVSGRYFAALLYQAHVSGTSTEKIIIDIYKFYSTLQQQKINKKLGLYFALIVSEALILTDHYKEGLYYIDDAFRHHIRNVSKPEIVQIIFLFQAIGLCKLNEWQKAEEKFDLILPFEFCFLSKKYMTLLYLFLSVELKRKTLKYKEQISTLIKETGFVRLNELFS